MTKIADRNQIVYVPREIRYYGYKKLVEKPRKVCACGCGKLIEITRSCRATLRKECGRRLHLIVVQESKKRTRAKQKEERENEKARQMVNVGRSESISNTTSGN